jgi:hypothetical protein
MVTKIRKTQDSTELGAHPHGIIQNQATDLSSALSRHLRTECR